MKAATEHWKNYTVKLILLLIKKKIPISVIAKELGISTNAISMILLRK